jgi:hypothetical protein
MYNPFTHIKTYVACNKRIVLISSGIFVLLSIPVFAYAEEGVVATLMQWAGMPSTKEDWALLISVWMLSLTGGIVGTAGVLLNYAVVFTVISMGDIVSNISGVAVAWSVLRDTANLVLIFSLLIIGIATILGLQSYGYKQLLARLIIVALLINFSLFLTKVVIDVSNLFAYSISGENMLDIQGETAGCSATFVTGGDDAVMEQCLNQGLSGQMMAQLNLATLYDLSGGAGTDIGSLVSEDGSAGKILLFGVLGSVLFLVTAFVMFAGAILLAIRFAVLVLLMIFSPFAFAASILPFTRGYWTMWLKKLFEQSFFAPAFLLLMWIALSILTTSNGKVGKNSNQSFAVAMMTGEAENGAIFINFTIITIFFIAALIVAKQLGAYGASTAINIGKSWSRNAAGALAAGTVGGSALLAGAAYRRGREAIAKGELKGASKTRSRVSKTLNVLGGAAKILSLGALSDRNIRGATAGTAGAKFGGKVSGASLATTFGMTEEARQDKRKREQEYREGAKHHIQLDKARRSQENPPGLGEFVRLKPEEIEQFARDLNISEVVNLSKTNISAFKEMTEALKNPEVARHLSAEKLSTVLKSDAWQASDKNAIVHARFNSIQNDAKALDGLTGNDKDQAEAQLRRQVAGMTTTDVKLLYRNMATVDPAITRNLPANVLKAVAEDEEMNSTRRREIVADRFQEVIAAAAGNDATVMTETLKTLTDEETKMFLSSQETISPMLAENLRSGVIDEVKKTSPDLAKNIREHREKALEDALVTLWNTGNDTDLSTMLDKMNSKEKTKLKGSISTDIDVLRRMRVNDLKEMVREETDVNIRNQIRDTVEAERARQTAGGGTADPSIENMYSYLNSVSDGGGRLNF